MKTGELRNPVTRPRIVVVGAGFGGLEAAKGLSGVDADVMVIDRNNFHLFQPLLYQVATAGLSSTDIAYPIRSVLRRQRNTAVLMATVHGVDTDRRVVLTDKGEIAYDYLVIATGSRYNYFGHDEWESAAPNLKSISSAIDIRARILRAFEDAEAEPDPEARRRLLTLVLVGAGPTGVELAGAIAELRNRALAKDFRRIEPRSTRILLVDAGPRILSAFPEELSRKARERLEEMGVEVHSESRVGRVDTDGVEIGGRFIPASTVIWTAGVKASPAAQWLGVRADGLGRVEVDPDLTVPGHPEIFVIGDTASVDGEDGRPLPGLAPVAMQQGRYVAWRIGTKIDREPESEIEPFHYKDKGNLATIGRSSGIADFHGLRLFGRLAWWLWLGVHLFYLIGFRNRVLVMIQWAWNYVTFQRGARVIPDRPHELAETAQAPGQEPARAA